MTRPSRPRRTRPLVGVAAASILVCGGGGADAAIAPTPAQMVTTITCGFLEHATVPSPAPGGLAERRAQLAVQVDGGVDIAIEFLAGHNRGVPNTVQQRLALGLLRRWRNSAWIALRGTSAGSLTRDAAHRQELAARAALALAGPAGTPCDFPGSDVGPATPRQSLALAFERARLVPVTRPGRVRSDVTRLRAAIRAMPKTTKPRILTTAVSLADALGARLNPAGSAAAAEVLARDTQPFLLDLLSGSGRAVAIDTPPSGLVRVPDIRTTAIATAYATLRAAGMHLVIPAPWVEGTLQGRPSVWQQSPLAGTPVPMGTRVVVSLMAGPLASPAVATPIPTAVVPELTGQPVVDAQARVDALGLYQLTSFAPLTAAANAAELVANYRVQRQDPAPDTVLALGQLVPGGGFRPTPVHLWAVQYRPDVAAGQP